MKAMTCPEDDELLAMASGDEITSEVQNHLDVCTDCRQRLGRLQAEVSNLREALTDLKLPSENNATLSTGLWSPREIPGDLGLPPSGPSDLAAAEPEMARPSTIGKYLVLDVLGRGGQADVYRALHPTLGKEVVIKLGRRAFEPGQADRDWLLAEGKVLAELDHPSLARVHDLDFHQGRPFLVMEYVRGRTLRQHAEEQRPTPRQAAALVAELARALAVAHRRGVVHQDLKPQNVLIDEAGRPRVIDFGMARLVHGWAERRAQPEGGTAAYMAPEQARGETERINPRSDIFALGGILYFLLVGQAPFRGRDWIEELERAARCDFDRQALRAAKAPRPLEVICLRAMAPEPADRHGRAEDLAADLERFVRRPRRMALTAVLVALGLLVWPAWKVLQTRPVADDRPQAEVRLPKDALSVRLFRDGQFRELPDAQALVSLVPLTNKDKLKISVPASSGLHASLFLIGSTGEVEHLADALPEELLSYPPGPDEFKPLDNRPGTEVLLVCWRRAGPIAVKEVQHLWGEAAPWPALPDISVLRLDRDAVKVIQRGRNLGRSQTHSDPEGNVRARLERLRSRLRDRVDFLAGVAFAHKDSSSAP
jgi:tRNA A-37 threonylcarbamoyl transferase component Bud32